MNVKNVLHACMLSKHIYKMSARINKVISEALGVPASIELALLYKTCKSDSNKNFYTHSHQLHDDQLMKI